MNRLLIILMVFYAANIYSETWNAFDAFSPDWRKSWEERKFTSKPTAYIVAQEQGVPVLKGSSTKSASGLWRLLDIHPVPAGSISWNWKVEHSLGSNEHEREKKGDDYAARVFVVFEPHLFQWKTRSICYVWAGRQPVGNIYASPYAGNVAMIVLESGDSKAGKWVSETRDFVADYKRFFEEAPRKVSAVAIMIDTDNTGEKATSYFKDLVLSVP